MIVSYEKEGEFAEEEDADVAAEREKVYRDPGADSAIVISDLRKEHDATYDACLWPLMASNLMSCG